MRMEKVRVKGRLLAVTEFKLESDFSPEGDQPQAIEELLRGIRDGDREQILLGVTGSGKTFTMARVIEELRRPALVLSHNKTLAAQLFQEFRSFFPSNAVEYFVSYYDYYQPEAYVAQTDTYIEKETSINEEIDKLRLRATKSLFERRDVVIVASVSCIYGLGDPESFFGMLYTFNLGDETGLDDALRSLVDMQYERTSLDLFPGSFRSRGDVLEIFPAYEEHAFRLEFFGDEIERIAQVDPLRGEIQQDLERVCIYPRNHYVTSEGRLKRAIGSIEQELKERIPQLEAGHHLLEAQRLDQRTRFDLEMMREIGRCQGIENYSRHLTGRAVGEPPPTLLDYFPDDTLLILDESHQTLPQVRAMFHGDRSRKQNLVDYGFRLPSALDNRPLTFEEFDAKMGQRIYISATPGPMEMERTGGLFVEQVIRPTGLLDPPIEIKPATGQVDDLLEEVRVTVAKGFRVLVTTLTKRMAEELTQYFTEVGVRVRYLHSDIQTLERVETITALRKGEFDVLVGVNLLREGLDMPEVALVAVLDADREGFLRSETSLIQVAGRAARNAEGRVIFYADRLTRSIEATLGETRRRREKQEAYNRQQGWVPKTIIKEVHDPIIRLANPGAKPISWGESFIAEKADLPLNKVIEKLEKGMKEAAKALEFEKAAALRDEVRRLKEFQIYAS